MQQTQTASFDSVSLPMVVVGPHDKEEKAEYDPKLLAFSFSGMEIRNLYFSPSGKELVDPVSTYLFEEEHTGGGCMALKKVLPDGRYFLLTDGDGFIAAPIDWDEATLGLYSVEGDTIAYCELKNVPYALVTDDASQNELTSLERLYCSCCGGVTTGRQWSNRDTGYGLCVSCIPQCSRNQTDEEFQRTYGVRGIHFDLSQSPPGDEAVCETARLKAEVEGTANDESQDSAALQAQYLAWARENLASDDMEIPENANVSLAERGAFVEAYVWVPNDAIKGPDDL